MNHNFGLKLKSEFVSLGYCIQELEHINTSTPLPLYIDIDIYHRLLCQSKKTCILLLKETIMTSPVSNSGLERDCTVSGQSAIVKHLVSCPLIFIVKFDSSKTLILQNLIHIMCIFILNYKSSTGYSLLFHPHSGYK